MSLELHKMLSTFITKFKSNSIIVILLANFLCLIHSLADAFSLGYGKVALCSIIFMAEMLIILKNLYNIKAQKSNLR